MAGDALAEAATAGVASACSKLSTYPFDLLKTKMAISEKNQTLLEAAQDVVKADGVAGLYRGSGPRVFKSVTGKVLYFYIYRTLSNIVLQGQTRSLTTLENMIVGYFSEIFELPVVMPLDAIATRVQLSKEPTSFSKVVQQLWRENKLFNSWEAYVLGAMQPALQNTIFDQLKARLNRSLSVPESFFLGVVAASISITLTYPLDFAKTMSQSVSKTRVTNKSTIVVLHRSSDNVESLKLAENHGLIHLSSRDLLDALSKSDCKLGRKARKELDTKGVISDELVVDFMYERISTLEVADGKRGFLVDGIPPSTTTLRDDEKLILARLSDHDALVFLKDQQKVEHVTAESPRNKNVLNILVNTTRKHGIAGVFKGLSANLAQGVLSAALMLMIKEKIALIISRFIERLRIALRGA